MKSSETSPKAPREQRSTIEDPGRVVRVLNVRLLGVTCAIVAAAFVGGYFWYVHRLERVTDSFLVRAETLEDDGKWSEAAFYLRRYLQINPAAENSRDIRVRLIHALEQDASSPAQRRQLVALLYEALGQFNEFERDDLRIKLAEQHLELGQFPQAGAMAESVLKKRPPDAPQATETDQIAARRVIAIAQRARAQRDGSVNFETAEDKLLVSLKDNPGDPTVATLAADLYRTHPDEVRAQNAATRADEIMDQLVAASPDDPEALMARYFYRRRYQLPNARQDLDHLLQKHPDHVEALLLVANEDFARNSPESRQSAEKTLKKVTQLAPHDPRGYLGLASVYVASGHREQAVELLTDARKQLESSNFEIEALLASQLLDLNRLDEAERMIASADAERRRRLPELQTSVRQKQADVSHLLNARLLAARNEWQHAIVELNAITSVSQNQGAGGPSIERLQALALMATIMAKLNRMDLAASHWSAVADVAPQLSEAGWRAGAAYLQSGNSDKAIEQLQRYLETANASPEAWVAMVQSHLQKQLRKPVEDRNWSEFDAALSAARTHLPKRWELQIAEAIRVASDSNEQARQSAVQLLQSCEQDFPSEAAVWARLVWLYLQLARPDDADRALARFDELEKNAVPRITLRAARLASANRVDEALELIAKSKSQVSPQERRELQQAQIRLLTSVRKFAEAQQLVSELIAASSDNPRTLAMGIEIALQGRDFETARKWEDALKACSTVDDFEWKFLRARRLIEESQTLDPAKIPEIDQLVSSLRTARPNWYPVITLAGQYAERRGQTGDAIEAYRQAIALGDNRPETLQRLVIALYADGQYDEANQVLTSHKEGLPDDGRFDSMAILSAVRGSHWDDALSRAAKAVERGSQDPMHYVWYGSLLMRAEDQEKAEEVFRKSVELFPKDSRAWSGLFTFLVQSGKKDDARHVLETWPTSAGLEGAKKHAILAQGYEALNDQDGARREYREAIRLDAKDVRSRIRLARLLLGTDSAEARRQYEDVLKIDPQNADARRQLAAILASSGGSDDWNRALKLLESPNGESAGDAAAMDDRLRAVLLALRGKNQKERIANIEAARQILLARLNQGSNSGNDIDQKLLVGIYELKWQLRENLNDTTSLVAARGAMRTLLSRPQLPIEDLVQGIEFSLRHLKEMPSISDESQRSELTGMLSDDAALWIGDLQTAIERGDAQAQQLLYLPVVYRARLMAAKSQDEEAKKLITDFAQKRMQELKTDDERSKLFLQIGNTLSTIGQYPEAEQWYRKLVEVAPSGYVLLAKSLLEQRRLDEAIGVCLGTKDADRSSQVATVLAQLLSTRDGNTEATERAQGVIRSALSADPNNVELLMSVAVLRVTENNADEAARLFRKVIEIDPHHVVAQNNLATILAEQPNQLGEAQKHIERAIEIAGRNPALLDTLGTIHLRLGAFDEAIAALEEAIAGGVSDPRYLFHLAAAYRGAGRSADARETLSMARQKGLDKAILTPGDRELLMTLEKDFAPVSAGI